MTQQDERKQQSGTPREVPTEKHEQGHTLGDRNGSQQKQGIAETPNKAKQQTQQGAGGPSSKQQGGSPNEGEGNRTAARNYNAGAQQSAQNPAETRREAEAARQALDGPERDALKQAEAEGRNPARR